MKRAFLKFLALALCLAMLSASLSGCGLLNLFGISLPELDLSFPDKPQEETETDGSTVRYTLPERTTFHQEPAWEAPRVAALEAGTTIYYSTTVTLDGVVWAHASDGWFVLEGEKPVEVLNSHAVNQEGLIFANTPVYEQPSHNAAEVAMVKAGTQVYVSAIATTEEGTWGQLEWGWIRLQDYYSMEDLWQQAGYGVIRSNNACFYATPDVYSGVIGTPSSGSRFSLLAVIQIDNLTWGYTEAGWITMDKLYEEGTLGFRPCRAVVTDSTPLNVRQGPGTGHAVVKTLNNGDYVDILERVQFNGSDWGYTGEGWIFMDLTKIQ